MAELFPLAPDATPYRRLAGPEAVQVMQAAGRRVLIVPGETLADLAETAFRDVSHLLRPGHLGQLRAILDDPEASANDRFVALQLLKNANVAAGMVLPTCQDTGTAIVYGWKGEQVWTEGGDAAALTEGIGRAYAHGNLRYSQVAPRTMFDEVNTRTNLPAELNLLAVPGEDYRFLFLAKGGGSANKTFLFQATPSILHPDRLAPFLERKIRDLGTQACPPYHLAVVIGGSSAEQTLKTAKLASARYLDGLPTSGEDGGGHAIRDPALETELLAASQAIGLGAQFGGKYFCHDVRVIRLPRHGGSLPIGIAVSCSADRQALARIGADGVFLEALERDPARHLPEIDEAALGGPVETVDLDRPMPAILAHLGRLPVKTRLALSGTLIVARDAAHGRLAERLARGEALPDYVKEHPIYYAGPAKTPAGLASGAFGPTTAARMDPFMDQFLAAGAARITIAKGNRSAAVTRACQRHGGFYLGSIGGPAALLARDNIRSVECLDFADLGMEAVWRITVADFPAFVVIDDKGNDFFAEF